MVISIYIKYEKSLVRYSNVYTFSGYRLSLMFTIIVVMAIKLRSVRLPIPDQNICENNLYRANGFKRANQMCVGGEANRDSCGGDSGAPLMKKYISKNSTSGDSEKYVLIGMVSYGPSSCGTPGMMGVYTRVTAYKDWILENLREFCMAKYQYLFLIAHILPFYYHSDIKLILFLAMESTRQPTSAAPSQVVQNQLLLSYRYVLIGIYIAVNIAS